MNPGVVPEIRGGRYLDEVVEVEVAELEVVSWQC